MLKEIITTLYAKHKKAFISAVIFLCIMAPISIFVSYKLSKAPYNDERGKLITVTAIINLLALSSVIAFIFLLRKYLQFKKHFVKNVHFPLHWQYQSGDLLVLSNAGIIQYMVSPPEPFTTIKFEGIAWSTDNLKEFAEDILKDGFSIAALLPSLKFKSQRNVVDKYISFTNRDIISFIFYDFKTGGLLVIDINNEYAGYQMNLVFPVPEHISFRKEEFDILIDSLDTSANVRAYYANEESLDLLEE